MTASDDSVGLRDRVARVRRELEELDDARSAAVAERAALEHAGPLGGPSGFSRSALRVLAVPLVLFASVGLGAALAAADFGSSGGVFYGDAVHVVGAAPVAPGARCSVFVTDGGEDWDARVTVLCAGRRIYGADSDDGYLDCPDEDAFMLCVDEETSASSGDPQLRLDRRSGLVRVIDDGWSVDVSIPPAGGGTP